MCEERKHKEAKLVMCLLCSITVLEQKTRLAANGDCIAKRKHASCPLLGGHSNWSNFEEDFLFNMLLLENISIMTVYIICFDFYLNGSSSRVMLMYRINGQLTPPPQKK